MLIFVGYALDPTVDGSADEGKIMIGAKEAAEEFGGRTVFEKATLRPSDKRKRNRNNDPADIEGFLGPWGGYVDEKRVAKPSEEEAAELEEVLAKRSKRGKETEEKPLEEKTVLHSKVFIHNIAKDILLRIFEISSKVTFGILYLLQSKTAWIIKDARSCTLLRMWA